MTLQKITILGSTGSIGVNTLDVIRRHPQRYSVVALCAHKQIDRLFDQCLEFKPCFAVVRDARLAADLNSRLAEVASSTIVEYGPDALVRMAELPEVDTVMAAIVGAAGLPSFSTTAQPPALLPRSRRRDCWLAVANMSTSPPIWKLPAKSVNATANRLCSKFVRAICTTPGWHSINLKMVSG